MSCYFRHLGDVLKEARVKLTTANRRDVDHAIHRIVGVTYKDCPPTWKAVKARLQDPKARRAFVAALRKELG